jgi:hypothetical protein
MRRAASVLAAMVGVAGFVMPGAALAGASSPDVARLTSLDASARSLQIGETFTVTASGRDGGSPDYELTFIADWAQLHLAGGGITCEGTLLGSPSADGPFCEFDSFTTTVKMTTHIYGTFSATAETPKTFSLTACAASFTNPPDPFPGYPNTPGGSCKIRSFTVS